DLTVLPEISSVLGAGAAAPAAGMTAAGMLSPWTRISFCSALRVREKSPSCTFKAVRPVADIFSISSLISETVSLSSDIQALPFGSIPVFFEAEGGVVAAEAEGVGEG